MRREPVEFLAVIRIYNRNGKRFSFAVTENFPPAYAKRTLESDLIETSSSYSLPACSIPSLRLFIATFSDTATVGCSGSTSENTKPSKFVFPEIVLTSTVAPSTRTGFANVQPATSVPAQGATDNPFLYGVSPSASRRRRLRFCRKDNST